MRVLVTVGTEGAYGHLGSVELESYPCPAGVALTASDDAPPPSSLPEVNVAVDAALVPPR